MKGMVVPCELMELVLCFGLYVIVCCSCVGAGCSCSKFAWRAKIGRAGHSARAGDFDFRALGHFSIFEFAVKKRHRNAPRRVAEEQEEKRRGEGGEEGEGGEGEKEKEGQ